MMPPIETLAEEVIHRLTKKSRPFVTAESCTGGSLAAALTSVAGSSAVFCGSAVTYREATKQQWLAVNEDTLREHTAVSAEVADQMAIGAMKHTSEATISLALTGHFGPNAPTSLDGVVFCAIAERIGELTKIVHRQRWQLTSCERSGRCQETVRLALQQLLKFGG